MWGVNYKELILLIYLISRLWQEEFKRYLRPLIVNPKRPNAADEYVSDLQHRYEELINGDNEIKEKAYKGGWRNGRERSELIMSLNWMNVRRLRQAIIEVQQHNWQLWGIGEVGRHNLLKIVD